MKKNVWIINQYNMPTKYGHLNRHFNIAKYLVKQGYNPTVFVGSYLHNSNEQIIKNRSFYKKQNEGDFVFYFIKTMNYAKSKLKRIISMVQFYINVKKVSKILEKPDVIIGSSAHPLAALLAIKLSKKFGCESIVEIRDLWPESFVAYGIIGRKNPLIKLLYFGEKWIYRKADDLVFTMEGGRNYIVDKKWDIEHEGKIDLSKIHHINNGVDLDVYNNNKKLNVFSDNDLNDENTYKVVYIGSIRRVNKVDKIVDVALKLKDENIKFLIWGSGDCVNEINIKIEKLKLTNIVLKGKIEKKYIPSILSRADLNIMLGEANEVFKYGISANKLFEYFASCKPTIVTFKSGFSIVEKYKAGIELENSDSTSIVNGIQLFKNLSNESYNRYCQAAKKASQDYDFKNLSDQYIRVIEGRN
ncbi:glycosyltransferase family 4 protein [Candidatus Izimaplasma bacterium]|nr:glycosyltransferase family 4 protein [Candidatus Izimaplasma bacterium]